MGIASPWKRSQLTVEVDQSAPNWQALDMSPKRNSRIVQLSNEGGGGARKPRPEPASAKTRIQTGANERAGKILRNDGGGEPITRGLDGRIRSSGTIGLAEPNPPSGQREMYLNELEEAKGLQSTARATVSPVSNLSE